MPSDRPLTRLRAILIAIAYVATLLGIYAAFYNEHPLACGIATATVCVLGGIQIDKARSQSGFMGALSGGTVGGVLAVVFHLFLGYSTEPYFEDEGLGLAACLGMLIPYGAGIGSILGFILWFISFAVCGVLNSIAGAKFRKRPRI